MQHGSSFLVPPQAQDFWADSWSPRGGFSPAAISGLLIWLHADFGVVASGSDLTSWTDLQSGKVGSAVATPQVNATGFNNRRSIEIDAFGDAVSFAGANGAWSASTAWTLIAAANFQFNDPLAFDSFFGKGADVNNRFALDQDNARFVIAGTGTNVDTAQAGISDFTGEAIHVLRANGSSFDGWMNGAAYSENTDTLPSAWDWNADVTLFNRADNVDGLIGHYRIWLLYDRVISNTQINRVVHKYVEPQTGLSTWSDI